MLTLAAPCHKLLVANTWCKMLTLNSGPLSEEVFVVIQNKPPQDEPQWYADYLELKATSATKSREISALPFNYVEEFELKILPIRDYQIYLLLPYL